MELSAALEATGTAERPRVDRAAGRLAGSRCPACGTVSWPGRAVCHRCGAAGLETVLFSATGTLLSWTRCWVPRPGIEPPFVLGKVRFPDGATVFGHVHGLADEGPSDSVTVECVIASEGALPAFAFEVRR
jgi:uncharacterized protein